MIRESRDTDAESLDSSFGFKAMLPLAVATSIDALAVGVTFAFLNVNILWAVTFNNEDGENRQDILSRMSGSEDITVEKYTYNGEPAAYVKWGDKVIGNLSAELAGDLARKYPKARYTAEILEISGGGGTDVRVQYRA